MLHMLRASIHVCILFCLKQDRNYLIPPLLRDKPAAPHAPLEDGSDCSDGSDGSDGSVCECMLTFTPDTSRQQQLTWDARQISAAIMPPGFFARLTGKVVQWMFRTNPDCNESMMNAIWKNSVEAYSTKFKYELLMEQHNIITIRLKAAMHCPERVLIPLKRAVQEVMTESNILRFKPRFLVPHDKQFLCHDTLCHRHSNAGISRDSKLADTANVWFPPRPANGRHHIYLTGGSSLVDSSVLHTLYEALLSYVEVQNEPQCLVYHSSLMHQPSDIFVNVARTLAATPIIVLLVSKDGIAALNTACSCPGADLVLFEWWLAIELMALNSSASHIPTPENNLKRLLPVLIDIADAESYTIIDSSIVCQHTAKKVRQAWKQLQLPGEPEERSVRSIVQTVCSIPGMQMDREASGTRNEYDSFLSAASEVRHVVELTDMTVPSLLPKTRGATMCAANGICQIPDADVKQLERVGGGNFGDVYKGVFRIVRIVAIKMAQSDHSGKNETELWEEAKLMAQFSHPNIVALLGIVPSSPNIKVVLEFCDKGSLQAVLQAGDLSGGLEHIPEDVSLQVAADITAGMAYLEAKGFVHRDLASRNVLVGEDNTCKVADFGMSRRLNSDYYTVREDSALAIGWCAPEVVANSRHTSASDVWSFFVLMWEVWSEGATPFNDNNFVCASLRKVAKGEMEPAELLAQPPAVNTELFEALQERCFCAAPEKRSTFAALRSWIETMLHDSLAGAVLSSDEEINSEHYLTILRDTAGGALVIEELERAGMITAPGDTMNQIYTSPRYARLKALRQDADEKEEAIVGGLSRVKIDTRLKRAADELSRHSIEYCTLFDTWRGAPWLTQLKEVHSEVAASVVTTDAVLQPNPWQIDRIEPSSKRYLTRILDVFSSEDSKNPVCAVAAACEQAVAEFGLAVKVKKGPPKKEERIMEKAAMMGYDTIRDYGRLSLIVSDVKVPEVVRRLYFCPAFKLVRAKNRLDSELDAKETAGYRDYQLLARLTTGVGWVVEIQVIPLEMFKLKNSLGHAGYSKYRFILEVCRRAKAAAKGSEQRLHVSFARENAMELLQYKDQVDHCVGWRNQKLLSPRIDAHKWFESWQADLEKSDAVLVLCSEIYYSKLDKGPTAPIYREAEAICRHKDANPDFMVFAFDPGTEGQGPLALEHALKNGEPGAHEHAWRDAIRPMMSPAKLLEPHTSTAPAVNSVSAVARKFAEGVFGVDTEVCLALCGVSPPATHMHTPLL